MSLPDFDRCYRAVASRDARFDGWFITAVTSTGIYCRPSCPTPIRPKRENVRFYPTAAAAQGDGFRACKRCRPDAAPGSPEWNARADLVGRAMRLITDGIVDRDGVTGLARRLSVSERHLHRLLVQEVGAGPIALARAQRAHTARTLIETTDLPLGDVAFAAGFGSIRQFNDTVAEVFAVSPSELRRARRRGERPSADGAVTLRLPARPPYDGRGILDFLGPRAVSGIESTDGDTYRRTLRLPNGAGTVAVTPAIDHVIASFRLEHLADLAVAVARTRRLFDLDADPDTITGTLASDPVLRPLVRRRPGRRVPGHVDGDELAVRAVLGQQVSVAGARTLASRLVASHGDPLPATLAAPEHGLTHLFPSAAAVAAAAGGLAMPNARRQALGGLARALAGGDVVLDGGADRPTTEAGLLALRGIGPWTASYIAMRALGDPDAFPAGDLGLRRALDRLGHPSDLASVASAAERWRPWRAYATFHLWSILEASS